MAYTSTDYGTRYPFLGAASRLALALALALTLTLTLTPTLTLSLTKARLADALLVFTGSVASDEVLEVSSK
jgi:hypothetical protein